MGLFVFGWFACWHMLDLFRADALFPMFIGEVLSVFGLYGALASCIFLGLWGIALLEINS